MTLREKIAALEAENAGLKAEVAVLHGHVCPVPAYPSQCTCTYQTTAARPPCPVHSWRPGDFRAWKSPFANACAGGALPVTLNTANTGALAVTSALSPAANACAGGYAGQVFTVNIPA